MRSTVITIVLVVILSILSSKAADIPDESWGYVPVRQNANMFWYVRIYVLHNFLGKIRKIYDPRLLAPAS